MKITAKKHINAKQNINASDVEYDTDEQYLMALADEIENTLLTDFDVEVTAWLDPSGDIHITTDMYDPENAYEGVIQANELVGLTGDLETDAYSYAEEFYTSLP